jgi:peroxiredoxin
VSGETAGSNRAALLIMGAGLLIGLAAGLVVFMGVPAWPGSTAQGGEAGPTATPAPAPIVGAPAPDFTLVDLNGNSVTLSDLQGQVVLINFWATWCGPCRLEMPAIEAEYVARKSQGFTVLAVDWDEPAADVRDFVESLELTFTVLLDPGSVVNDLYRVRGYPTTFFVNRDGYVDRQHIGFMTTGQLATYLDDLGLGE